MGTASPAYSPLSDEWCMHRFNHLSPELAADLPDTLARMRSMCPVAHSEEYGGFWVVTRYEDVVRVAQDWETFSSAHGLSVPSAPTHARHYPVQVDPPIQRVYKRLVNAFFTPAALAPWEQPIRGLAGRLIDGFVEDGSCDFMDAFARPFPALSFFDLALHAPAEEVETVAHLASTSSIPNHPDAAASWAGLSAWVTEFLDRRRRGPVLGDMIDAVLNAEIEGRPITQEEIVGTVQLLILGGLETTAGSLGLMMLRFCGHPEIAALLRSRPELVRDAVEELLRLDGSFIAIARTAMRDTELGGKQIRKGDKVVIYWASANRDEAEFPDPDTFRIDRSPNRHLSFGLGPHRCVGSNLARLSLRIALEEVLGRLDDIKVPEAAAVRFHSTLTRAPLHLPITFTPGPKSGGNLRS